MATSSRLRRVVDVAYQVDGVLGVRAWVLPEGVTVAVQVSPRAGPTDVLRTVEAALAALREPGEQLHVGLMDGPAGISPPK